MCYSDVIFLRLRQSLVLFTHADCDRRLLRRMALRNKFLSPTCAPDLKDIDTYFFFEKIFRSDIRICVTATSVGGFSDATGNLKKYLRIHFFQK